MRVIRYRLREFQSRSIDRLPTPSVAKAIKDYLRPDFDLILAQSISISRTEAHLLRLTKEQYTILDELEDNHRCLFDGAAGTGKTLLGIEYARRANRRGLKVLLACFSRLLGDWLRHQTRNSGITAGTWHSVARLIIVDSSIGEEFREQERIALSSGDSRSLFGDLYPLFGMTALEEIGTPFDVLVIDEAQDLSHPQVFDFFNYALRGGLAGGRWVILGDFTRQALYGHTTNPLSVLPQYTDHYVRARLTLNCRNSRRIAEETTLLAGFETPPFRYSDELGLPVRYEYWKSRSDLFDSLSTIIERLVHDRVSIGSVMLLCPRRFDHSTLADVTTLSKYRVVDVSRGIVEAQPNHIRFSTVHSFKGLESEVVILFDFDISDEDEIQSLLYVAMSRARSLLILMINEKARRRLRSRIRNSVIRELNRVQRPQHP